MWVTGKAWKYEYRVEGEVAVVVELLMGVPLGYTKTLLRRAIEVVKDTVLLIDLLVVCHSVISRASLLKQW